MEFSGELSGELVGQFDGQLAIVTGASRGIGRAIAKALAEAGATVIGTATSESGASNVSEWLAPLGGMGKVLDITQDDSVTNLFKGLSEHEQKLAILVNNAGITRDNLAMRMKDEEWSAVIETNLTGVFRMCKGALRPMMRERHGRIINVGSVVGSAGNAGQMNYAAAKAGLIGMSKSLAREVASRSITVNVVAPGFIDTDMTQSLNEEQRQAILEGVPMGCLGSVGDVAATVSFLASEGARYITGETIHVNGGMYMG